MPKKINIREQREAMKKARTEQFKNAAKEKKKQEEFEQIQRKAELEEKAKEALIKSMSSKIKDNEIVIKKSRAKATGLKSTFTINENEILMTSFGKGNKAIMEKKIIGDEITSLNANQAFSITNDGKKFNIKGRLNATADNPLKLKEVTLKEARKDLIGLKDELEKRFFGRTFEDNIHIQLIYNILDIEKILSSHVNNIIYELDNVLNRDGGNNYDDIIGYLGQEDNYNYFDFAGKTGRFTNSGDKARYKMFTNMLEKEQLAYFGSAFYNTGNDTKSKIIKTLKKDEKDIYYILCLLGMTRQAMAHGVDRNRDGYKFQVSVYTLEKEYDELYKFNVSSAARKELREILDKTYNEKVNDLNKDFIKKASKNLVIIFNIFNAKTKDKKAELLRDYYDFIVKKDYKNIGFSLKKIRENILENNEAKIIKDKKYDTIRPKLYQLFDFMMFEYYKENSNIADNLVNTLRANLDENGKEKIYIDESNRLWKNIGGDVITKLLPHMNGNEIKGIKPDVDIDPSMLSDVEIGNDATYFSKLIYLITLFQDGKEINDLLTTLINKCDNISSFIEVLKTNNLSTEFSKEYTMFAKSAKIVNELKAINSFARMEKPNPSAKKMMFVEAAQILGVDGTKEELENYFDVVLDKKKGLKNSFGKKDTGLRNFIASNVIESNRFKYLVRYNNSENTRKIASNKKVVEFVLNGIPETQIIRYYNSCTGKNEGAFNEGMRGKLADIITNINFNEFENVKQNDRTSTYNEKQDKVQKQAIITLYLTVLYLATKNLVYVNSRYFLAFHALERDSDLYGISLKPEYKEMYNGDRCRFYQYNILTKKFLDEGKLNKKSTIYINQNIANTDDIVITKFRNQVAHLNAIRNAHLYLDDLREFNSYYEIYHYLVQRSLMADYDEGKFIVENTKVITYFDLVKQYKTYCKDFVKALNTPFAYNLPRYKNLSIVGLFDMNNPGDMKEKVGPEND